MDEKKPVDVHYDSVAENYHEQYDRENLYDLKKPYPANYFRMQYMLNSFAETGAQRVIEVGVGEGTPLANLATMGADCWGFDISENMVARAKETFKERGLDDSHISWGDITDVNTYMHMLRGGRFDGAMAMGVMPHVRHDDQTLQNIKRLVKEDGRVFIEFRNKLFSLFTFNRYTFEFIMDDLLSEVSQELKASVGKALEGILRMDLPPVRRDTEAAGYDEILSRFHNPLEIEELFRRNGYDDIQFHWYHYHAAPPLAGMEVPELFRADSINLEFEPSGWKGLFLCSAFVVEATA